MSWLHPSVTNNVVRLMDSQSAANLSAVARQYREYSRDARAKRRRHCLRLALIRLRFLMDPQENKVLPKIIAATQICNDFDYQGPPECLRNFGTDQYNILENMTLTFDDKDNYIIYLANVYGLVAVTPDVVLNEYF